MEIDWLTQSTKHHDLNFTKTGESWHNIIGGKRYADDIMLYSRVCCENCMQEWLSHLYSPPMIPEWEGAGWAQQMCDLPIQICFTEEGLWVPRIRKLDKNESYLLGLIPYPARARFAPGIDTTPKNQIRAWVIGGWITEFRRAKGITHQDTIELVKLGAFRLIAELLLLGHAEKLLTSIIHSITQDEIRWLIFEAAALLKSLKLFRFSEEHGMHNKIKDDLWQRTVALNLVPALA